MNTKLKLITLCQLLSALCLPAFAQGTAFTYQGRLNNGNNPANGSYDLTFMLFSVSSGGSALAGPLTNSATTVSNGLFTTIVDFGPGVFTGTSNWLEIAVRTNGTGGFTTLAPRQQLTPAPYAIFAGSASNLAGVLPAGQLSGTIPNGNLPANPNFSGTVIASSFQNASGSFIAGTGNTNGSSSAAVGGGLNNYIQNGSQFSAIGGGNNNLIMNLAYDSTIGGGVNNRVSVQAHDATIGGGNNNLILGPTAGAVIGGGLNNTNLSYYGTIAGGSGNFVNALAGNSIGGGVGNTAYGVGATVPGGYSNVASGNYAFAAGYQAQATNDGAFVWADSQNGAFGSTTTNQFSVRANGGVVFVTSGTGMTVDGNPVLTGGGSFVAGAGNTNGSSYVAIGGGLNNYVQSGSQFSAIGGGNNNLIMNLAYDSTIGGGVNNRVSVQARDATIGGGNDNLILGPTAGAVIGGGLNNTNLSYYGTIAGGSGNFVNALAGNSIGGGVGNTAYGVGATVPGGYSNVASGNYTFAAGYQAQATNDGAFVWADSQNGAFGSMTSDSFNVRARGGVQFITSGAGMTIDGRPLLISGGGSGITIQPNTNGAPNIIGGSPVNFVANGVVGATIGGGGATNYSLGFSYTNSVTGDFGTIAGGRQNIAGTEAAVGGGIQNTASGVLGVVAGGSDNTASSFCSTVPGGFENTASGNYSFAAGRQAQALHQGAFVWADSQNAVFASTANDQFLIRAQGGVGIDTASTPEGDLSINTNTYLFSHVLHLRGETGPDHNHALAYNGNTVTNFGTGQYQVDGPALWGFGGGLLGTRNGSDRAVLFWNTTSVGIGTNNPSAKLQVTSNGTQSNPQLRLDQTTSGDYARLRMVSGSSGGVWDIAAGGGSPNVLNFFVSPTIGGSGTNILTLQPNGNASLWGTLAQGSDRAHKENIKTIDSQVMLAKVAGLPISEWNYITEPGVQHVGPMAQDFYAAFGVGPDDKHITTIDEGGVALAAIQGLNEKVEVGSQNSESRMQKLENENAELRQQNGSLEKRLEALEKMLLAQKSN